MARRRWHSNKHSLVSCNQHKLAPMQRITQLEFGQSSHMLRRSARHCYKSSLSSQPESTAPWYDAWFRMRPHRCHSQAPSERICGWLPLPRTVGVPLEPAVRSRAGHAVSMSFSRRCLNKKSQCTAKFASRQLCGPSRRTSHHVAIANITCEPERSPDPATLQQFKRATTDLSRHLRSSPRAGWTETGQTWSSGNLDGKELEELANVNPGMICELTQRSSTFSVARARARSRCNARCNGASLTLHTPRFDKRLLK